MQAVYGFIASATASTGLDMTMYALEDPHVLQLFAQAAAHGVGPRVILNASQGSQQSNAAAYQFLSAHQVTVKWASSLYDVTHQKTIRVGSEVMVMTLNTQSQYYPTSRDFAVLDTDPGDASSVKSTFEADLAGTPITPPPSNHLVWSPTDAKPFMLHLIGGATTSLMVESEEMSDPDVIDALCARAKAGVGVQVVMTDSPASQDTFHTLAAAGVHVATYDATADLYIHAKVTLADAGLGTRAGFLGSQNDGTVSLTKNRELGIHFTDSALHAALDAVLTSDFSGAQPWKPRSSTARR